MSSAAANFNDNIIFAANKMTLVKKSEYTPSKALKKLYKSLKKIFVQKSTQTKDMPVVYQTCLTEEEHQNYLNELLEAEAESFAA
ncbi:uncharacterized protein LOC124420369 [Lucilia cuprina]|uniref:uncharacterized protein LOC124420369 n=1 Tax=Lucilia cuprina TaxID=7375 RepID=UPI001F050820|nr:uncharacterized protein LOC124420369 [Lucilia cuprina]